MGVRQMSDEYILDDVVETFSDEDTLLSDIRFNPCEVVAFLGNGLHHVGTSHLRGGVGELGVAYRFGVDSRYFCHRGNCSSRLSPAISWRNW